MAKNTIHVTMDDFSDYLRGFLEQRQTEGEAPVDTPTIGFKRLSVDAVIPTKAHETDSGFDLYASEDVIIEPGETAVVPTGIAVQLPAGMEAQVRPRSGVTSKTKLRVQLGTIDNDYRGDIGVIVDNTWRKYASKFTKNYVKLDGLPEPVVGGYSCSKGTYLIRKGDKLAQLVVQYLPQVQAVEVDGDLSDTARGSGGFGSTGVRE